MSSTVLLLYPLRLVKRWRVVWCARETTTSRFHAQRTSGRIVTDHHLRSQRFLMPSKMNSKANTIQLPPRAIIKAIRLQTTTRDRARAEKSFRASAACRRHLRA